MKWRELWKKRKQIISDNGISGDRFPDDQTEDQDDQTIGMSTGDTQRNDKTLILGERQNLTSEKNNEPK